MVRRWFYVLLGFTFPFFWAVHAAGTLKVLYYPLQLIASTTVTGWPSFVTASLLYAVVAVVFEITHRTRKNLSPE
ncbi:MAG: hypothetical protein OEM01_04105 [Desulfobulbaceae bacterium]|nr:hypothetical protein [Desulfobulbaceae bacterium]